MMDLPFRQIHLDFHTSEAIPDIGAEFDPDEFGDTLVRAHVNSITCFARCHHGWNYYRSEKHPERVHPDLKCDLLPLQIEACHSRGIRVPVYITVQWDHLVSRENPEWLVVDADGRIPGTPPFEAGFYRRLCLNTPYVDFLEEHTAEVAETMDIDGVFFDIVQATPCCCRYCIEGMVAGGMDPADSDQRREFAQQVLLDFQERMFEVVRSRRPEAQVFFNSGHAGPAHREMLHNFTHLELESLPGGAWGYSHFPVAQRYARGLGADTVSHTGKFHTTWGDFHSFKNPAALEFECLRMLALGSKCEIGDQLHPGGKLCEHTYDLVGGAYAKVEAAEPWCVGAEAVVDIGMMTPEEFVTGATHGSIPEATFGAVRMLQEAHCQFDVIDSQSDFSRYRLLVLPDEIPVDDALAGKITDYLTAGGALLASYRSGLAPDEDRFNVPELGVVCKGEAPFAPDFIVPGKLGAGMRDTGHVMYKGGLQVQPAAGVEVLSTVMRPYFNRTWEHFCSHRHTPMSGPADYPGAVRAGSCIYLMHPVFSLYEQRAPLWCKHLVANAIDLLVPDPVLRAEAPSTAIFTVNEQAAQGRLVVHALHYIPDKRSRELDIVEDIIPIYDIPVSVRVDGEVASVALVPQGDAIDFEQADGRVNFTIPAINGTQMIEIKLG